MKTQYCQILDYTEPLTYEFNFITNKPDARISAKPNTELWSSENTELDVKDSCLIVNCSNPYVTIDGEVDMNLNTNLYKAVKVILKNETNADRLRVYFDTDDYNWSDTRSVSIKIVPNDVIFREYIIDMSQNSRWTNLVSRCKIGFNNTTAEGTVSIDRIGYYPDLEPSEIFYEFSKESNGVNTFENSSASFSSVLKVKSDGKGDVRFKLVDNISADASKFKYLQFSVYNTSSAAAIDIYYTTESDSTWTKTKSVLNISIKSKSTDVAVYTVDMRKSSGWTGKIKNIMLAIKGMNKDEVITFNSIAMINREILPDININFKSNANNFIANANSAVSTNEVGINCVFTGENGGITSPSTIINANKFGFMKVKLKNNTMSTALRFQWLTENDNIFDIKKNQNIIVDTNSSDMKEYIIPLIDNQYWHGNVTKLKLMPAIGTIQGDMTIESIIFTQYADVSFLYRDVKEGFIVVPGDYGWIKNTNGGEIAGVNDKTVDICNPTFSTGLYLSKLEIKNFGNGAETSAWKFIANQNEGILQWNFTMRLSKIDSTGNTIKLMNDNEDLIKFVVIRDSIYLNDGSVNKSLVRKFNVAEALDGINVRVDINNETRKFSVISLNDEVIVKTDAAFMSQKSINRLFVGTDGSCQNVIGFSEHISKINEMYEDFNYSKLNVKPLMFESEGDVKIESRRTNITEQMYWNSTLGMRVAKLRGTVEQAASVSKTFVAKSNVIDTFVKFLVKKSDNETYIKLLNGTFDAIRIKIEGEDFNYYDYNAGAYKVLWSKFKESHPIVIGGRVDDIWYTLKVRTYTETGIVELSINGVEIFATILPSDINTIDTISLETKGEIWFNDIRINDYRPTIVPYVDSNNRKGDIAVGVDAWQANTDSAERFYKNERIVNKRSYLGYTNDWDKESFNWQLKWMAENGIDFITYFFVNLGYYTVDTYIDHAEYNNKVNFAYTIDHYDFESIMQMLPYFVERLFRNPKYIKHNNKPVLFYFNFHPEFPDDFQEKMNKYVNENSVFDGIELVNVAHPIDDTSAPLAKKRNIKYITEYWKSTTPELLKYSYEMAKKHGLEYILKPSVGEDSRAWGLTCDRAAYDRTEYVTPTQFYNNLKFAKEFLSDKTNHTKNSFASKVVFIDNWSEFGEGHAICPYGDIGFGYINQVRRVFAGEDGLETGNNSKPSAFVDHLFPTGWMIEKLNNPSFEQTNIDCWQTTDDAILEKICNSEFDFEKYAVKISKRNSHESVLYQDITNTVLSNGINSLYNISAYVKPTQVVGFKDYDSERVMTIFSSKFPNMVLALSENKSTVLLKHYDENDIEQKWIVCKVDSKGIYSHYTFQNCGTKKYITEEFENSNLPQSRINMRPKSNSKTTSQIFAFLQYPDTFTGENIFSVHNPLIAFVPDAKNREISKDGNCEFKMEGVWNNHCDNNVLFNLVDVNKQSIKQYCSSVKIYIEISDSTGIRRFACKGNARLCMYTELTGCVKVEWHGDLNYARFVVNGDTISNLDYFVDECEMRYIPIK